MHILFAWVSSATGNRSQALESPSCSLWVLPERSFLPVSDQQQHRCCGKPWWQTNSITCAALCRVCQTEEGCVPAGLVNGERLGPGPVKHEPQQHCSLHLKRAKHCLEVSDLGPVINRVHRERRGNLYFSGRGEEKRTDWGLTHGFPLFSVRGGRKGHCNSWLLSFDLETLRG